MTIEDHTRPILERVIAVLDENPMVEESYQSLREFRKLVMAGDIQVIAKSLRGCCPGCQRKVATESVGRRLIWPKYCEFCGVKIKVDSCTGPVVDLGR